MLIFDRRRKHDDFASTPRRQRKARRRRADIRESSELGSKTRNFDAQSRAMRFVGVLRPKGASEERAPRHVRGPRFAQRARKRKQHRTCGERDDGIGVSHDMAACVNDQRTRSQQRFNVPKQHNPLLAGHNQAGGRRVQDQVCTLDLCHKGRDACLTRGARGLGKRGARRFNPQAPHRDASDHELVGGPQSRRQDRGIELRQCTLGLVEAPDQQQTPDFEMPCMRGVGPVAVPRERRPRGIERLGGKAQVARDERDLGLSPDASRTGHGLFRTEGTRRLSQQGLRPNKIAELRHGDAAQRQGRRVIAQSHPLQCAERITRCEGMRCGSDQRVHGNPDKLVTPTVSTSGTKSLSRSTTRNGETDMPDILHKVGIKSSSPDNVYQALTTVGGLSGWWTSDTHGENKVGGVLQFRFGNGGFDMKVLELKPGEHVLWQVVDGPEEWLGTKVSFDLKQNGDWIVVLFKHQGWKAPVEFMHHCSTKWAVFLLSLKSLLETGKGAPWPNEIKLDSWE
jgi:hypothetical protein